MHARFRHRFRPEGEARLARFADEVKLDRSHVDPEAAAKLAETTDAPADRTPEERVEEAVKSANDAIARHNEFASKLSPEMRAALRQELGAFMATTIDGFDKNGV